MRLPLMAGVMFVTCLGVGVSGRVRPVVLQSERIRRAIEGESLFRSYCASCHGRDGKGHGPVAEALKRPPADLTRIAQRNGGTFPLDRVERLVANGDPSPPAHGGKDMPVWGPIFGSLFPGSFNPVNPRIEDVVRYVESIQAR